jgi:GntR family transcriptional regulator
MENEVELNNQYVIDKESPVPYYYQLKMFISSQIESGNWRYTQKLPSETVLCMRFDISRTVVRQALKELQNEGYLSTEKGKGTFIARPKITSGFVQNLAGFHEVFQKQGYRVTTKIFKQAIIPASQSIGDILHLDINAPLVLLRRLRLLDDEPSVYADNYIPEDLCPNLINENMENRSLYAYLEEHCGLEIYRGHRYIGVTLAKEYEASILSISTGSPLIEVESVTYLRSGRPLEFFHSLHRGDMTRFEVNLVKYGTRDNLRHYTDTTRRGLS